MKPPVPYNEIPPEQPDMGRPAMYEDSWVPKICELVAQGSNLSKIGRMNEFPSRTTMCKWLNTKPYFATQYAGACQDRAEWRVEKLDQIAEDLRNKVIDHHTARFEGDIIKWQAGKEKSSKFGEASLLKIADADGNKLPPPVIVTTPQEAADAYAAAIKSKK